MSGRQITGLVPIEIDGETFHLRFSFNALCEIEEDLGIPFESIFGDVGGDGVRMSLSRIGTMLYYGAKSGELYRSIKEKCNKREFSKSEFLERMNAFDSEKYATALALAMGQKDDGDIQSIAKKKHKKR